MRNRLASLFATSILSVTAVANAQPSATIAQASDGDAGGPRTSITTNPLEDLVGLFNLSVERAVTQHASVQVDVLGAAAAGTNNSGNEATAGLFSLTVQPHFYFGRESLSGGYVAPFVQVAALDVSDSSGAGGTVGLFATGATVGWSWLAGPVNVKLGAGPKVGLLGAAVVDSSGKVERANGVSVGLTMDLSMGFAF